MTVTSVKPFACTHGGVDAEGTRTYTNLYDVYTDDINDGPNTARFATGLPAYNDTWAWGNDFDQYALCKTRSADLAETDPLQPYYKKWRVTLGYTTASQKRDPTNEQQEPQNEPWKISGSYAVGTKTVDRDKDGKALTNSAEEPVFDTIPNGNDTLILEGNTLTINLATRRAAMLHCNESAMWGLDARQLLLMQWSYDILYKGNDPYVRHRLEFHIATDDGINDKWDFVFIDKGTRTIVDAAETDPKLRYKPVSAQDIQLLGGIYLDGNGAAYDIASFPLGVPLTKYTIPEFDFLSMGFLPDPLPGPFS